MMNLKQKFLMGATIMLLATGNFWAQASPQGCASSGGQAAGCSGGGAAPEIDAASGAAAIALLTGVILLLRKGRKSKTDETKSEV